MAQTNMNLVTSAVKELDLAQLRHAVATLKDPQGDLARRNARSRVKAAIKKLLADMDARYPAPPRKKVARKIATPLERRKWLIDNGWVMLADNSYGKELLSFTAFHKLPVRKTPSVSSNANGSYIPAATWIPGWVAHYYPNVTITKQAQRNPQMIQAANSAVRLGSLAGKPGVVCAKR